MGSTRGRLQELERIFAELRRTDEASFDVADLEPELIRLLALLREAGPQSEAEAFMVDLVDEWPDGPVTEALEFTMRELRWEGVHAALLRLVASDTTDSRIRDQARRVLEAFEGEWPSGEIYAHYREPRM